MKAPTARAYTTGSVTSADGTTIGYRKFGEGPGLILVHGGMQAAQNFTILASNLADAFTVYVPDRRGRGRSGPFGDRYSMDREREDLGALVTATGSQDVFGLSSGALIVLCTALSNPAIGRVALYEPPFPVPGRPIVSWAPRFDIAVQRGDLGGALAVALKATLDPSIVTCLPEFVLAPPLRLMAWAERHQSRGPDDVPIADLIPTFHYDTTLVRDLTETLEACASIKAEVFLLGGSKSQPFLRAALDDLARVIPRAQRVELPGVGHVAADNDDEPELVAGELRQFFQPVQATHR